MASKGKKTKHVIQDTGEMSDSNYSKLVEMGVGRPILPHEIELKNLSEEVIASGTWTVRQMFDYLEYMLVGECFFSLALSPRRNAC